MICTYIVFYLQYNVQKTSFALKVESDGSNTSHKSWDRSMLCPLCSIPSSFSNIWKHLELRRPAAGPLGGILSRSCLIEDYSCSAVLGLLCCIWNVFRSVQHLNSSTTKPCCWKRCRMWFNFVLMKYARPSLKKTCCCKTFQHPLMEPFQMCWLPVL